MSVKVRRYRRGGWEVDITVLLPDGIRFRERKKASVSSLTGARRWGEARERELLRNGPARVRKEVPTLRDFVPRFLEGYARANRQKPSGIAGKETILRVHLVPALGARHLDAITTEDVQRLKRALENRSPKTVNNVLTVLNTLLKQAVAWDVIETVPCTIRLLKAPRAAVRFHDFEAFERLVVAADRLDRTTRLLVLLGGEAGLRCGEMMALKTGSKPSAAGSRRGVTATARPARPIWTASAGPAGVVPADEADACVFNDLPCPSGRSVGYVGQQ